MFSQTQVGVEKFTSESHSKHFRNFHPFGDKHIHDNHTSLCINTNIQGVVYSECGLEDLLQVSFGGLRGLHPLWLRFYIYIFWVISLLNWALVSGLLYGLSENIVNKIMSQRTSMSHGNFLQEYVAFLIIINQIKFESNSQANLDLSWFICCEQQMMIQCRGSAISLHCQLNQLEQFTMVRILFFSSNSVHTHLTKCS